MATAEMTVEEDVVETSSADRLVSATQKLDTPTPEPWKEGSNPETATDIDWLFDVLMV